MTTWCLLAPGPSSSKALADRLRGFNVGAIGNAFELAPWAQFLAATDFWWWMKHPKAREFSGKRYSIHVVKGVQRVPITPCNSGVLALECAKRLGATTIKLYGFDMHGTHFFGRYTNGLANTSDHKRKVHMQQYAKWGKSNPAIIVINCTPGSALKCFPMERAEHAACA